MRQTPSLKDIQDQAPRIIIPPNNKHNITHKHTLHDTTTIQVPSKWVSAPRSSSAQKPKHPPHQPPFPHPTPRTRTPSSITPPNGKTPHPKHPPPHPRPHSETLRSSIPIAMRRSCRKPSGMRGRESRLRSWRLGLRGARRVGIGKDVPVGRERLDK